MLDGGEWNGRNWVDILGKTYGGTFASIGTWSSLSSCLEISPPLLPDAGTFTLALVKLNYATSEFMSKKVAEDPDEKQDFEHQLEEFQDEEIAAEYQQEEEELQEDIKETGVPYFGYLLPTDEEKFDVEEEYGRLDDKEDQLEDLIDEEQEQDPYIPVISHISADDYPFNLS